MNYKLKNSDILYNNEQLGPYPDHLLKRVDMPTNAIPGAMPQRKAHADSAEGRLKRRTDLPEAVMEAKKNMKGKREPLAQALTQVRAHARAIKESPNPVSEQQAPIPDDPRVLSRHIKSLGYFLGADAMGICEIPEYGMYLDDPDGEPIGTDYKYAIIFAKRKNAKTSFASSGFDAVFDACSHQCYQVLGQWSETVANYIRRLGFEALASNSRNYVTVMPALLLAAGLGESGRLGIVVNPFFGPNFKACCVVTNMPLEPDKPIDFGLQEYCKSCGICAEQCVSKAISRDNERIEYNGYLKYKIDYEKCVTLALMNKKGGTCGRCALMCPWNRPESEPRFFENWDGDLHKLYESVNARAKFLRDNDFVTEESKGGKWWFDLQEVDGRYIIPGHVKFEEEAED